MGSKRVVEQHIPQTLMNSLRNPAGESYPARSGDGDRASADPRFPQNMCDAFPFLSMDVSPTNLDGTSANPKQGRGPSSLTNSKPERQKCQTGQTCYDEELHWSFTIT